ncbi:unnamed protein product [Musa banksii]
MATFQLARSGFSPALRLSPPALRRPSGLLGPVRIRCRLPEDKGGEPDGSGWEEPPESLFMKELRRRGMTPTSLLEDSERGALGRGQREMEAKEDSGNGGGGRRERGSRNGVASVELEKGMTRPRERFMSVNSEGLEVGIRRHLFLCSANPNCIVNKLLLFDHSLAITSFHFDHSFGFSEDQSQITEGAVSESRGTCREEAYK